MKRASSKVVRLKSSSPLDAGKFCVGQIVRITSAGCALVDYPGNPKGPIQARSVVSETKRLDPSACQGAQVLLAFENQDPALPIVVGILHDTLFPAEPLREVTLSVPRPNKAVLDGKSVVLDAQNEITLRCGKSCMILRKDGKIVLKGIEIVSHAAKANKLKGSTVRIN